MPVFHDALVFNDVGVVEAVPALSCSAPVSHFESNDSPSIDSICSSGGFDLVIDSYDAHPDDDLLEGIL